MDRLASESSSDEIERPSAAPASFWFSKLRPPILYGYVFSEVLSPFLLALFVFTGILFLARSLKLVDLVVNKNVSIVDILMLFSLIIPQFLEIAIPMALLLGLIIAFGRLSSDSELVVMRAAGISIRQLVRPVFVFSALCLCACLMLGLWIRPLANYRMGLEMFEMAKMKASAGLVAGIFNDFGPLTIYSEQIDDTGSKLNNVLIADRRDPDQPRNFVAKYGQIVSDNIARTLSLRLFDGSIHEGRGLDYNVTYFDINNIVLGHDELVDNEASKEGKKANEMYLPELLSVSSEIGGGNGPLGKKEERRLSRLKVEFHRRFVIPFSCLAVALIGMALGVQPSKGGRSWGLSANITVGILVVTGYYLALALATALGEESVIVPWFIMWLPNVIFCFMAVYVYRRIESEEWMAVSQALGDFLLRIFSRLRLTRPV